MPEIERENRKVGTPKLPNDRYQYIEFVNEKWRFKGYRAGVIDAILGMRAREESAAMLARDLDLPVAAVEEAIQFVDSNPDAIAKHQRRMLKIANEHSHR